MGVQGCRCGRVEVGGQWRGTQETSGCQRDAYRKVSRDMVRSDTQRRQVRGKVM